MTPELRREVRRTTLRTTVLSLATPCVEGKPSDARGYVLGYRSPGRNLYVHRRTYETAHGPIPAGKVIDHLCHNRACLNVEHMEAVTAGENSRRGMALITHCKHGHEFDETNTYINRFGARGCRTCHRDSQGQRHARMRASHPSIAQERAETIERDLRIAGGCVAPHLDQDAGPCRDRWRNIVRPDAREALTVNHVREHSGGRRRSVPRWMTTLCWGHGVQGWELSHVELQREYLSSVAT